MEERMWLGLECERNPSFVELKSKIMHLRKRLESWLV
jgi:hypothetical protein